MWDERTVKFSWVWSRRVGSFTHVTVFPVEVFGVAQVLPQLLNFILLNLFQNGRSVDGSHVFVRFLAVQSGWLLWYASARLFSQHQFAARSWLALEWSLLGFVRLGKLRWLIRVDRIVELWSQLEVQVVLALIELSLRLQVRFSKFIDGGLFVLVLQMWVV